MEDDGIPLPLGDWAIEPQSLGPGLMAARTLFSDSQILRVARVLNNSPKAAKLFVNSLFEHRGASPMPFRFWLRTL